MSTILDALRKVEEDKQAQNADARARLLGSSARTHGPLSRRRHTPWTVAAGLTLAGFAAGAGLMFLGPRSQSGETSQETRVIPSGNRGLEDSEKEQRSPAQPAAPPATERFANTAQEPPTPPVAGIGPPSSPASAATSTTPLVVEQEILSPDLSAVTDSSVSSPHETEQEFLTADVSAVQRSPFVASPPTPREIITPAKPAQAPSPRSPQVHEETLSEILLPNGTTRVVNPPPPVPVPAPAPTGTALSFLQWSSDPEKRIAFIRVNGGPLTMAHEGDIISGYTVVEIRPDAVDLRSGEALTTLRVR